MLDPGEARTNGVVHAVQVTIEMNTTAPGFGGALGLQEVAALYDGRWLAAPALRASSLHRAW